MRREVCGEVVWEIVRARKCRLRYVDIGGVRVLKDDGAHGDHRCGI